MQTVIAFYISSHGFGHMTRSLAIIEKILITTNYKIYVVCGKVQNDFAREYLELYFKERRVIFHDTITDIGLINEKNSLNVDKKNLIKALSTFIMELDEIVLKEYHFLKSSKVKCIISDISPIGPLVGAQLGVETIGISNFTWIEQYKYLKIDQKIIEIFQKAYSKLDHFIEYALALPISHFSNQVTHVGFVSRKIDKSKVQEIKAKYGRSVFLTCGKSANLKDIDLLNYRGNVFTTTGFNIKTEMQINRLPMNILDTQNYIASSDLIVTKAGWSTIAEALIAKRKLVLIERPSAFEDSYLINLLKSKELAISIKESDLGHLDIIDLENKATNTINVEKIKNIKNDIANIIKLIC